jgi:4-amino-4-deoxy-L-arabinose transferase-like glycosyltransferase
MQIYSIFSKISSVKYFPAHSKWAFISLLLLMSFVYNYHSILFLPTQGIHQWRQCDCLSITLNYCQDDNAFLEPSVHNLGRDNTGKTMSENPVIFYLIGNTWKLIGQHEFIYRLFVCLLFFIGLYIVFRFIEDLLKDSILALFSSLFLFTSPTLVYYANNYLMDVPALSLAMIGLCYLLKFYFKRDDKSLYIGSGFYAMAGLLKVSSLLTFTAFVGMYGLEQINYFRREKRISQKSIIHFTAFILVCVIQILWYSYSKSYNAKYNSGNFLVGILPIWEMSSLQIQATVNAIFDHVKYDYFRTEAQVFLVLIFLISLIKFRKINSGLLLFSIFSVCGLMVFCVLFFNALKDHDYYTINLFSVALVVLIMFFHFINEQYSGITNSIWLRIFLLTLLIHTTDFARRRMNDRYSPSEWQNRTYKTLLEPYTEIEPYLASIGIKKDDKVICLSDNSINISLYLMNRKGWTNYGINGNENKIQEKIKLGARYLFIHDAASFRNTVVLKYVKNKVGTFKNIHIYRF